MSVTMTMIIKWSEDDVEIKVEDDFVDDGNRNNNNFDIGDGKEDNVYDDAKDFDEDKKILFIKNWRWRWSWLYDEKAEKRHLRDIVMLVRALVKIRRCRWR